MKRILAITDGTRGASYRMRLGALIAPLKQRDILLDVRTRPGNWVTRRGIMQTADAYDAVLLHHALLDPSEARLLRRRARKIFLDIDEALMIGPGGFWSRRRARRQFRATAAVADHVVAGNEYLAQMFRELGRPAVVLHTLVDPAHYQMKAHQPTETPRLVWIGSRATVPYLRLILLTLERLVQQLPQLRLVTICDEKVESDIIRVEHVEWSEQTEAAALTRGDIGISFLPDDPWTRGKCAFKIVQYMASGLPTIASPVGANTIVVRPNETGVLPPTFDDWAKAIVRFVGDVNLRAEMGANARTAVEKQYSLSKGIELWAKLLGDATAGAAVTAAASTRR